MEHFQKQHGNNPTTQTDEYGNPVAHRVDQYGNQEYGNPVAPRADQYGNPVAPRADQYGNPLGQHDTTATGYAATTGAGHDYERKGHGATGVLSQKQYGANPTDEYGNPVAPRVDQYGNPLGQHDTTATGYAATTGAGHGEYGHDYERKGHGATGVLRRSGSSSSSSSEDDGQGGRRKKGLKQKVKGKLPGGGNTDTTYGRTGNTGEYYEKPGMMDKVKEKLPGGGHKTDSAYGTQSTGPYGSHTTAPYETHTTAPYGGTGYAGEHYEKPGRKDDPYTTQSHTAATTTPYGGAAYPEERHEKKGIMEKIKEKLPGGHH